MRLLVKALTLWVGLNAVAGVVYLFHFNPYYGAISVLSTVALVVALLLPEYRRAKT
jgi:hypothetical protein